MSDNDAPDIPPALSKSEWAAGANTDARTYDALFTLTDVGLGVHDVSGPLSENNVLVGKNVNTLAALMALANAAINDEDPRKIRREWVTQLRGWTTEFRQILETLSGEEPTKLSAVRLQQGIDLFDDMADALESYLPPATSD